MRLFSRITRLCPVAGIVFAAPFATPLAAQRPALASADIAEIVALEKIEDRRDFDAAALQRIAASAHPELRRRAALAIARLYDPRGRALLQAMRTDADTVVLATVVWATGQLVDTSATEWLGSLLDTPATPPGIATEAAGAFGKIRTSDTRARLSRYLLAAAPNANTAPVVGEALLSIGRHQERGDLNGIERWASSPDMELRWRAVWALVRPRDPEAVASLIQMSKDPSAEVRHWAVRGLTGPRADSAGLGAELARDVLLEAVDDTDRRVRIEAVRALGSHRDGGSLIQLIVLLEDEDPAIAALAAEAIGARGDGGRPAIAQLTAALNPERPAWVRAAALTALIDIGLSIAAVPANVMARDTSLTIRTAAVSALARLKVGGRAGLATLRRDPDLSVRASANAAWIELTDTIETPAVRRAARRTAFASPDVAVRSGAARSMRAWADSTDIPMLLDAYARALRDTSSMAQAAIVETLAEVEGRGGNAAAAFFTRFPAAPSDIAYGIAGRAFGPRTLAAWGTGRPIRSARTDADYKRIVETLVVPAYNGAPAPRLRWETTRGNVDTELNPLDTPLATDYLLQLTAKGAMRRIRFGRVVPNFVAQQAAVELGTPLQRDEISRGRLANGRLSWGSNIGNAPRFPGRRGPGAAYDTGPAVYTFGINPAPHNEGDFSALGSIVAGLDVVDQIQLGDYVRSVRVLKPGEK